MYWTPQGERVLLGAERYLFEETLGMMVDELSVDDAEFGVEAFDELQRGQKLFVLYRAGRALLHPDEPKPQLTGFLEGGVAAVYRVMLDQIVQEIDDADFSAAASLNWRRMAREAFAQWYDLEECPQEDSSDKSEWDGVIECLEAAVLWDNDFEVREGLDADPDASSALKLILDIPDNYFTEVPFDVSDDQLDLYIDALKGLTPRGRGFSGSLRARWTQKLPSRVGWYWLTPDPASREDARCLAVVDYDGLVVQDGQASGPVEAFAGWWWQGPIAPEGE